MSRFRWSHFAYNVLLPDEQLDLFGCRQNWLHGVERQLALAEPRDRTLCGSLLPGQPKWVELSQAWLQTEDFCPGCRDAILRQRRERQPGWQD